MPRLEVEVDEEVIAGLQFAAQHSYLTVDQIVNLQLLAFLTGLIPQMAGQEVTDVQPSEEERTTVLTETNIVQIISELMPLTQEGTNYKGLCPFFHATTRYDEENAEPIVVADPKETGVKTFLVDPRKKLYYCFHCHASGNVIRFVMLFKHVTFPLAVEYLQKKLRGERGEVPTIDWWKGFWTCSCTDALPADCQHMDAIKQFWRIHSGSEELP